MNETKTTDIYMHICRGLKYHDETTFSKSQVQSDSLLLITHYTHNYEVLSSAELEKMKLI